MALSAQKAPTNSKNFGTVFRRMYERRATEMSVAQVGDMVYPVENWSQGGALLGGDNRFFAVDQVYDLTLRFKLSDRVVNVKHPARVIRRVGDKTALQFLPLTTDVRHMFSEIVDDMVANQFAQSQA